MEVFYIKCFCFPWFSFGIQLSILLWICRYLFIAMSYSYELSPSIFNLLFLVLVLWAWSCSGCFLCPTDPISWIKVSTHSVPLYFYKTNYSGSIINFSYPIENWATFPRVIDLVSWRTVLIMNVWILVIPGIY